MGRELTKYQILNDRELRTRSHGGTWLGAEEPRFLYSRPGNEGLGDSFLDEITRSRPFWRLKHIGFLGAIDFLKYGNGSAPHRRRHTRFEHSIAVSALAVQYADAQGLSVAERRVFGAAGLLHDIGHGPLSHTLEPVFREVFEIDHHLAGLSILRGTSPWGEEIREIFRTHDVDVDAVIALLSDKYHGPHQHIFSGPINIDTIEAINRCRLFLHDWTATSPAYHTVRALATSAQFPVHEADSFWELKNQVYNTLIHSRSGQILDAAAQAYMRQNLSNFSVGDFYRTETTLRRREPRLFAILDAARDPAALFDLVYPGLVDEAIFVISRHFWVDRTQDVSKPEHAAVRYRQTKSVRRVQFLELLRGG